MRKPIAVTFFVLIGILDAACADVYDCMFPTTGRVIIDTREPGNSITVGGEKKSAQSGSYFYQTDDGAFAVAFKPDMKTWEVLPEGEVATNCKVKK